LIAVSSITIKRRRGDAPLNPKDFVSHPKLKSLVDELKKYIATPWVNGSAYDVKKYLEEKKAKATASCSGATIDPLCQSHAGNLLEHSQWTAYQIQQWANDKSKILEGVDLNTALVAAFTHDMGKGGDCIYDMYSNDKYNKKGDRSHPENCGDLLMGTSKFYTCNGDKKGAEINVKTAIAEAFPKVETKELALAAYMHWEFGEINRAKTPAEVDTNVTAYVKKFKDACTKVGLTASKKLLKLCMAVSCADIAGSTNVRISRMEGVLPPVYFAKDGWVMFGMDGKHQAYIDKVLAASGLQ